MKKNIAVLVTLIFFIVNAAFAQQTKRIVRKIVVKNNKVVSTQTILSKIKTKEKREYSPVTLSDDIKRLYASGLFRDVSADVLEHEKGVSVIFNVKEKPILEKIVFTGNRRIRTKKLLSKMKTRKKEIFDKFKLKEDIEEIEKFYAEKGYSLASISHETQEKENKVGVIITINEGGRVRIRKITFSGNKAFRDKRLLKLIKTRKRAFFRSGFFKEEVLREDVERITAFYHREGFIDIKVSPVIEYDQKKIKMFINFEIEEGKQYKVGQVSVKGSTIVYEDKLKSMLTLDKDVIYSEAGLRDDISFIQSYYFDRGYIGALVKADTLLNSQTGYVDIKYDITEASVAYVDKVNIKGNVRTKEVVIRREMRLFPGDRYNGKKLKRSRQRLHNLGYFEEVTFDTAEKPTTLPDKYDLDIFVKETKTGEFSFGAGYSSIDNFIGFIDLTQRNFDIFNPPTFTGAGQKLRIRMEFGADKKDYEVGFVEPWFLGYPVTLGFNIYNRTREWTKYDEKRIGGNVFVGREFGEYWRSKLIYRYEGIRISNVLSDASQDIKDEEGKNYISSLTSETTHDTRDNIYNPTMGMHNVFSCEIAGSVFEGDKDFVKYYTKNSKYFPLTKKAVLEFRGRLGFVEAFGSTTKQVPIYERFYAGGANTIRGYKERRVGPEGEQGDPIGGRLMFIFNTEYTYNLAKNLKWAFFYDIGNVWAGQSEFDWDNLKLKASIGTGMRVKTPLGPIRLDYGYALDPKPGDRRGRFHFTMSHEF